MISIHIILNRTISVFTFLHPYSRSYCSSKKILFCTCFFINNFFPCSWNSLGWMSRTEHLMEIQFWTRKMHLFFPYVVFVCLLFYYLRSRENKCWMYTLHYISHLWSTHTELNALCNTYLNLKTNNLVFPHTYSTYKEN